MASLQLTATGLFSPRASPAELREWKDNGRNVMDLEQHGFMNPLMELDPEPAPVST